MSKIDKQEVMQKASEILGVAVNEKDLLGLKAVLANWHSLPDADKAKFLRGESA